MDLCHVKRSELAKHLAKYSGRDVLRVGQRQDDSGHKAVFTVQGAFASQMAAALLGTISRVLDMAGEAHDAVSAATMHMTEAPRLLRSQKQKASTLYMRPGLA